MTEFEKMIEAIYQEKARRTQKTKMSDEGKGETYHDISELVYIGDTTSIFNIAGRPTNVQDLNDLLAGYVSSEREFLGKRAVARFGVWK